MSASATTGPTGLLVGYGSIGRRHLTNLHGLGVDDWVVVHTGTGTLAFEPPCPVRTYPTLADALDAETPTFAVVANPTALHLDTALACTEHGCDLLLEKPVSHTLDGLDALDAAVARARTKVLVGFQFRYHPALQRIRDLVRDGTIGEPLRVRVVWAEYLPDWHPWEDWRTGYAARPELGGGVHHTICHPLDYLRMCFGDPLEVRGSLSETHPLGLEVAEAADLAFRFARGVEADVHLDYWARPPRHQVDVIGTDGSIAWDYLGGDFRVWTTTAPGWRVEPVPGVDERNDLFLAQSRHFLDVVARRAEPTCTLADGIQAVRITDAVERSSAAGAVRIAWPPPADPA